MYLGNWQIDDFITWTVSTHDKTGGRFDAASVTYRVYEDETTTPILTGSMLLLDSVSTEGFFSERIQLTSASGFERGKSYSILVVVTFSFTDSKATVIRTFQIGANATEVVLKGTVDNTVAPTSTVFEADDITEATADHYKDRVIIFKSGVLRDQAKDITAYALVAGRGRFTTSAFTEAPGNNDEFLIV